MRKPRVLLALFNETATKGIFDTKSIDSLAAYADLDLVHASPIDAPAEYFDRVYRWPRYPRRELAWLARYHLHLLPFTRRYYPERLGDPNLWQGFSPREKRVLSLFDNAVGRKMLVPALRAYLVRTNPLRGLLDHKYDAIVCVTGLKDPMYEDLVRFGQARKIPVFAITQNWDNVNFKPIFERPDLLGVWGMQGYYVARLVHGFGPARLIPIGAARMDIYFAPLPEPTAARRHLGLPRGKRILLFAGAGPPFDEAFVIDRLNAAISSGELPSDVLVLYKPHPRRSRTAPAKEKPLDFACLDHVKVVPPTGPGSVSVNEMPILLRAVDAVISPYSTLLLEGALCGRPCLAMAYDDPAHSAWKWSTSRTYIYLAPLAFARWALACVDKAALVGEVVRLLGLIGNEELARRAREDVLHILFHDDRDFGARVADALAGFINGRRPV